MFGRKHDFSFQQTVVISYQRFVEEIKVKTFCIQLADVVVEFFYSSCKFGPEITLLRASWQPTRVLHKALPCALF